MSAQLPRDAHLPAPAAAAAASQRPRRTDHRFYAWAGVAAFAIIFAGFARTYFLKFLFGAPALPWFLHLHGALMTSWFALFFVQTYLVASHQVRIHRRLGVFGAILAAMIVIVGVAVAIHGTARDVRAPQAGGPPPLVFLGFLFAGLLVFSMLVGAALLLRRRRDFHARLMLLSCLSMVGPGLARISFARLPELEFLRSGGPAGLFGLDILVLYACIIWDTWRHRRLHPAFVIGLVLLALMDTPFIWRFLSLPAWTHLAASLVSWAA